MNHSIARSVAAVLFLALVGIAIYSNTLDVPFYFDDTQNITENPEIRLVKLNLEGLKRAAFDKDSARGRPVGKITFALNYYFHEYDLAGYHVVNIVIHVVNGILLFLLVRTTLGFAAAGRQPASPFFIAFLTGLFWLVNPVHTQSVTYIVQRLNSLAALFFMTSMLLYIHGRRKAQGAGHRAEGEQNRGWGLGASPSAPLRMKGRGKAPFVFYGLSGLSWLLALGCKQTATMLPFFIFIYEWYFFQGLNKYWLKRGAIYILAVVVLFLLLTFIFLGLSPLERLRSIHDFANGEFSYSERLLTQPRVVLYYLSLLFYPHPSKLTLDYDFPLSRALIDPVTTLFAAGGILILLCLAAYLAKRDRVVSYSILWFFGNLVIESSFVPLAIIYEHRTYLPSMLVCLATVVLVFRYVRQWWVAVGIICALSCVFSIWTYQRNEMWRDPLMFWRGNVEKSPRKARVRNNLGIALLKAEKTEDGIAQLRKSIRIDPNYEKAYYNLGNAFAKAGKQDIALYYLYNCLKIKPDKEQAHNNVGVILARKGQMEKAIRHYRIALRIAPDLEEAHNNLGNALRRDGELNEAIRHYREAIRIRSDYAAPYGNMGLALAAQGRTKEAVEFYKKALRLKPNYVEAHLNAADALLATGKDREALSHIGEALRLRPGLWKAHLDLAKGLRRRGDLSGAVRHYKAAIRINPNLAEAHNDLGVLLAKKKKMKQAVEHFSEAVRLRPDFEEAGNNLERARSLLNGTSDRALSDERNEQLPN